MGDYEDVFASFEFHYNWFKTDDDVTVRFTTSVAVVVFVVVTGFKVFGVSFCNFLVSETIADSRVEFVKGFPFKFVISCFCLEETGSLDGTFQC